MKKLDLVKHKDDRLYKRHNLIKNTHGIVIDINYDNADVIFFNSHNVGDCAIVNVKTTDLDLDTEKLPKEIESKEKLSLMENEIKDYCNKSNIRYMDYFHHEEVINNSNNKILGYNNKQTSMFD